jgi:predicted dehydrogenase
MPSRTRSRPQHRESNIQQLLHGGGPAPLRVAAVGVGWVSQNRHLPAIWRRAEYELVGVIDAEAGRAEAVAGQYEVRHAATTRLKEVDWLETVDAIVIGAPAPMHGELIEQGLALKKHVLTEKPFVTSLPEGHQLARAARSACRVLAVVHNFQFTRAFACLQRDMTSGRLGEIYNLLAVLLSNPRRRLPGWCSQLPGGLFFDESPHLLYLARRLLPGAELEQVRLTASSSGLTTPKEVYAQLRNRRGQGASLLMRFEAEATEWHLTVSAEHGTADIDMLRDIYLFIPGDSRQDAPEVLSPGIQALRGHLWGSLTGGPLQVRSRLGYGYDEVLARFAAAIRCGTLQPEHIGCADALSVLKLQQEILTASRAVGCSPAARAMLSGLESAALLAPPAHLH